MRIASSRDPQGRARAAREPIRNARGGVAVTSVQAGARVVVAKLLPTAWRPGRAVRAALAVPPLLACGLAVLPACGGARQRASASPPVPVTIGKAVRKSVPVTVRAIGHIEPIATVAVKARIGGELQKVWFVEGQVVSPGAVLFTIDPRAHHAALRQAEAQLVKDKALLGKAEADVERMEHLITQDFVTRQDYDQAVANAAALRATVALDAAAVDNASLQLSYCTISSPIEGRTGNLNVKVGNLIKADDQPLVTINQIKPIAATFSLPAQYLNPVLRRNSEPHRVFASAPHGPQEPSEGALSFVDNAVDTSTSTIMLKATFANDDESLWPGQFVDVRLILGTEENRLVVPSPAVQTGQQGQYVFVVRGDGTAEMRPVKVARMDENEAVIGQGLSDGETVVTDGQLRLVSGAAVSATQQAAPGTSRP